MVHKFKVVGVQNFEPLLIVFPPPLLVLSPQMFGRPKIGIFVILERSEGSSTPCMWTFAGADVASIPHVRDFATLRMTKYFLNLILPNTYIDNTNNGGEHKPPGTGPWVIYSLALTW